MIYVKLMTLVGYRSSLMIEWQDDKDVFGRMFALTGDPIFKNLRNAVDHFDADLSDALSWGQLKSKKWLVEELEKVCESKISPTLGKDFICAGWYGLLANMLFEGRFNINIIRSFDIDENCAPIADSLNRSKVIDGWKFKAITKDILKLNYYEALYHAKRSDGSEVELIDAPDTIINTSCEHIKEFERWYLKLPKEKLVILQSNDYFTLPEHINCVKDLDEFKEQCPMKTLLYSGVLESKSYNRFMLIGII